MSLTQPDNEIDEVQIRELSVEPFNLHIEVLDVSLRDL